MTTSLAAVLTGFAGFTELAHLSTNAAEESGKLVGRLLVVALVVVLIVWLVRRGRR